MSRLNLAAMALAAAGLAFGSLVFAQVQRTFVASYGSDANTAMNCSFANPCRGFAAAQAKTVDGGEIVALDAAGYGAITIIQNLSIVANPGFYAGITASSGSAITIATPNINVLLRGLNINSTGGTIGVNVTNGAGITIEGCVISGFSGANAAGIQLNNANTLVRVSNTVLTRNFDAVRVAAGNLDVVSSKAMGNSRAGFIALVDVPAAAYLVVSDSVSTQNQYGIAAVATIAGAQAIATASHVAATTNQTGIYAAQATSAVGRATVAYSNVSNNVTGFDQGSGTLESAGNNIVRNNTTDINGTITVVPMK